MSDNMNAHEPALHEFDNDELRFLRKNLSMSVAQMESRLDHGIDGVERDRLIRDLRHANSLYFKVQGVINHRLIGDDDE